MPIEFETIDGEVHNLASKFEVCPKCEGKGKHDHPAFSNGITSEEWERDWDEDSREGYISGRYDVKCSKCDGLRVIEVIDESRTPKDILKQYRDTQRALRECDEMWRHEIENGA